MPGYFYFLCNRKRGVIYSGVTADVIRRTGQHKEAEQRSFTQRYGVTRLVYIEIYDHIEDAIKRE